VSSSHRELVVRRRGLWHNRDFVLLFGAQVISLLGSGVTTVALALLAAEVAGVGHAASDVRAVAVSRVAVDTEAALSPAVAAILLGAVGVRGLFWVDAASYLVSALLIGLVALPARTAAPRLFDWRRVGHELGFGARVLLREPGLRRALLMSFAEAAAGAAAIVATVTYVQAVLQRGDRAFLAVMTAVGIGSSAAALLGSRVVRSYEAGAHGPELHRRRHRWTSVSLSLGGAALAAALLPGRLLPPLFVFAALWLLNGAGQALVAIASSTLVAEHTTSDERARAYAAHFAITHFGWLIAYPVVGLAAARWGSPTTFTAVGLVCVLVTAVGSLLARGSQPAHEHSGV
jgi:NRE family putative nickel resistance protein-like MFS transporter